MEHFVSSSLCIRRMIFRPCSEFRSFPERVLNKRKSLQFWDATNFLLYSADSGRGGATTGAHSLLASCSRNRNLRAVTVGFLWSALWPFILHKITLNMYSMNQIPYCETGSSSDETQIFINLIRRPYPETDEFATHLMSYFFQICFNINPKNAYLSLLSSPFRFNFFLNSNTGGWSPVGSIRHCGYQ
jgi:hypothetical protein